jgi:hypothetical protein
MALAFRSDRAQWPEELTAYTELTPDRVDALRDWMLFA